MRKWLGVMLVAFGLAAGAGLALGAGSMTDVASAASTSNFYFSDFTADYYLSKDTEGVSRLRVVENLTAVFPDYKQNKGICREIPLTNQNGMNVTLPDLNRRNITVLRNGVSEPIYSIEKYSDYYEVCTGTNEYVLGEQKYTLEYEFEKVVTDFGDHQELYWDTNGNGWSQRFDKVTARVHLEAGVASDLAKKRWCYVGRYGESGQNRCMIATLDDGVEFTTQNLKAGENLTFDVELKPGSFVVPAPEENYTLVWVLVGLAVACSGLIGFWPLRKWLKVRGKKKFYKSLFVKPEYQPDARYSLPEMAEVYMGKKKDVKVAMLLNLIVQKKVTILRGEGKQWNLRVESLDGVRRESVKLLTLLNGGGTEPVPGEVIEIKKHAANPALARLNREIYRKIEEDLTSDGLMEAGYKVKGARIQMYAGAVFSMLWYGIFMMYFVVMIVSALREGIEVNNFHGVMVMKDEFVSLVVVIVAVTVVVWVVLARLRKKYEGYTERGLEAARYMEGLKMYIEMAEAERLKFLQSVEGADVTAEGIVKLYERLLPYAAVFGLEESWMNELERYCQVQEITQPDFLTADYTVSDVAWMTRHAVSYANASAVEMSSSGGGGGGISGGGGFSSGGSGGGGGGSSGGGGGGGGGGGR